MEIKALQKTTLVDYPRKVAVTVFTAGCNFRCCFCYNLDLLEKKSKSAVAEKSFFDFLESRKKLIDGVCITGGEPTIQPGLAEFIKKVKKRGFLVKLDTNGSNPDVLENLFQQNLLDYIAMDIKCSTENYPKVIGQRIDIGKIQESAELIRNNSIDYEFRTTAVPGIINKDEIEKIGKWLNGSKKYYLQQFRNKNVLDKKWRRIKPYSDEELGQMIEIAGLYFGKVGLRGI